MARKQPDWQPGDLAPAPGAYWRDRGRDPYGLNRRYERAVQLMHDRGWSRSKAAKKVGITLDAFDRINLGEGRYDVVPTYTRPHDGGKARIRRWVLADEKHARALLPAPLFETWQYPVVSRRQAGAWKDQPVVGWSGRYASIVGSFWQAVDQARMTGITEPLEAFVGFTVTDITGRRYTIPSVDTILAWINTMADEDWSEFWKQFESRKLRGGVPSAA
jgi:hypothetical protein